MVQSTVVFLSYLADIGICYIDNVGPTKLITDMVKDDNEAHCDGGDVI